MGKSTFPDRDFFALHLAHRTQQISFRCGGGIPLVGNCAFPYPCLRKLVCPPYSAVAAGWATRGEEIATSEGFVLPTEPKLTVGGQLRIPLSLFARIGFAHQTRTSTILPTEPNRSHFVVVVGYRWWATAHSLIPVCENWFCPPYSAVGWATRGEEIATSEGFVLPTEPKLTVGGQLRIPLSLFARIGLPTKPELAPSCPPNPTEIISLWWWDAVGGQLRTLFARIGFAHQTRTTRTSARLRRSRIQPLSKVFP